MTEQLDSTNREYLISPKYWEGHEISDNCIKTIHELSSDSNENEFFVDEYLSDEQINVLVEKGDGYIKDFIKQLGHIPIQTFTKNDVFYSSFYEEGQIVRFEKEKLIFANTNPKYDRRLFWGVVMEHPIIPDRTVLIEAGDVIKCNGIVEIGYSSIVEPIIQIGLTSHTKSKISETPHGILSRINWLQIMDIGSSTDLPRAKVPVWNEEEKKAA